MEDFYFIVHLIDIIGTKPDRSFSSPFHHSHSKDQIFAEVEANREGSKPVIFTYVFIRYSSPTNSIDYLVTKIVHPSIWINFLKTFKMVSIQSQPIIYYFQRIVL